MDSVLDNYIQRDTTNNYNFAMIDWQIKILERIASGEGIDLLAIGTKLHRHRIWVARYGLSAEEFRKVLQSKSKSKSKQKPNGRSNLIKLACKQALNT